MNDPSQQPAQTYLQLRQRIFGLSPTELGLIPTAEAPHVWGVVVELGYEVGCATLVALADGTTSLHYSTGGGLLGRADYAPLAQASRALVSEAQQYTYLMTATTNFSLPEAGQVCFFLLTYAGIYTTNASEIQLAAGAHPLAPLFQRTQETLGQLHVLEEKKRKRYANGKL